MINLLAPLRVIAALGLLSASFVFGQDSRVKTSSASGSASIKKAIEASQRALRDYRVASQDTLLFTVVGVEELTKLSIRVPESGVIRFPYLKSMSVVGKTLSEISEMVAKPLDKDYIINPQVVVSVDTFGERVVSVLGEVNKPGPVLLWPDRPMRILNAISSAGGLSPKASKGKIELTRAGKTQRYSLDSLTTSTQQPTLEEGDVIIVGESFL